MTSCESYFHDVITHILFSANPTCRIQLDKTCAWNIDTHRGRSLVAFGYAGECHVYHIKKQFAGKKQATNQTRKNVKENSEQSSTGPAPQRQAIFETDSKKFQKGVKFSPDGLNIACCGSDG